jgi:hypothetical protein
LPPWLLSLQASAGGASISTIKASRTNFIYISEIDVTDAWGTVVPAAAVAGCFGASNERPPSDAVRLTSAEIDRVAAAIPMGAAAGIRYPEGGMRGVYI